MKGIIAWFSENTVAANLSMFFILGAGLLTIPTIKQEVFPEFSLDMINISVVYLGAAPEEVEEGVCIRIEEEIQDLEGIKRISSVANEGVGTVTVEVERGTDPRELLDDLKARIDGITTFPVETEKPVIIEVTNRRQVIDIAVWGDVGEKSLKVVGQRVRDEIAAVPGITQVELIVARPYEVSIEVSEAELRKHGLTFDQVAQAIRRSSFDLPGGSIRSASGDILLRTKGQAYDGLEFEEIVLLTRPDGTRLMLNDIARVVDGFAETDQSARFGGAPAVGVRVFRVGDQAALDVAAKVNKYVREAQLRVPEGITLTAWNDSSRVLRGRLDLMLRNAKAGYILVFLVLALFLRFRLAFWVSLGIPISFLGAMWLMPMLDISINMISLFAFIVVLGIVVDDAIIVGENIHSHQERGEKGVTGARRGASRVAVPVVFGVLTTIAAFSPLLAVEGTMGKMMSVVPTIVIATLVFSLFESLCILPAHLGHGGTRKEEFHGLQGIWRRFQSRFTDGLATFIEKVYRPALEFALRWRYATIAWAVATLLITIGLVAGGRIKFQFFPSVESDFVSADLTLPPGTAVDATAAAIKYLEDGAIAVQDELQAEMDEGEINPIQYIFTSIGSQPFREGNRPNSSIGSGPAQSHIGELILELLPSEERNVTSAEIMQRWREKVGSIPDAIELSFSASLFSSGEPINIQLTGPDIEDLQEAAERLKLALAEYAGVFDITDSFRAGKREIKLGVKPAAEAYGVSRADLARQVRQAFYGEEAQRIQRGRDDVRIMVRFPEEERRSLGDLENMRIRTPSGGEVPFPVVAEVEMGRGFSSIRRVDQRRALNVTADVDASIGNAGEILGSVGSDVLPGILADYQGINFTLEGEQREQRDTMGGLRRGFMMALLLIYGLMAIPFRSYLQPLMVMSVIPFGIVGAIWGHIFMGLDLSILSLFGIVALTGVVVNDSIVLVHFVNTRRDEGVSIQKAVHDSGVVRFRPILLTSLTTFVGLSPLLLERSMQAKFLIPMATSLGFGVMFATVITLFLIPASYMILEDLKTAGARSLGGRN